MTTRTITLSPTVAVFKEAATLSFFAALTGLGAQVAVRLPFSPVPVTLQVLVVLAAGLALGSRRGFASQVTYLAAGVAGLPVFAGGAGGPAVILGPTGGYLMAFPLAALATGWISERLNQTGRWGLLLASLVGVAIIYAAGVAWLANWLRASASTSALASAWQMGAAPFVAGDLVKAVCASAAVGTGSAALSRWFNPAGLE